MTFSRYALTSMVVLVLAASARGDSTVTFILENDPAHRTFLVEAAVSEGDNMGLAGFVVDLVNIDSVRNVAPRTQIGGDNPNFISGFTIGNLDLDSDGQFFSGQDNSNPNSLYFGIGQTAGQVDSGGMEEVGIPWDAPVLLGTGTYEGPAPPDFGQNVVANTFDLDATHDFAMSSVANVVTQIVTVPEPTSIVLLGVGLVVVFRCRRSEPQ